MSYRGPRIQDADSAGFACLRRNHGGQDPRDKCAGIDQRRTKSGARTLLRPLRPKGGSPRVETCRKGRGRMERSSGMIYIYSIQEREGVVSFVRFSSGGYGVMAGRGELGVPVHPHRLYFNRDVFIFLCPWHECFRDSEEEGGGGCSGSFVHLKQMSIRLVTCPR